MSNPSMVQGNTAEMVITESAEGGHRLTARVGGAVGMLFLLLLPLVAGGYWTFTLGLCFANAIAIISVSFLVRYGGEVSIGQGVFVAAGAYTVALLEKYLGLSLLVSLPVAAVVGAVLEIGRASCRERV